MDASNRESCSALGNLCALQMYSGSSAACQAYSVLLQNQQASSLLRRTTSSYTPTTAAASPLLTSNATNTTNTTNTNTTAASNSSSNASTTTSTPYSPWYTNTSSSSSSSSLVSSTLTTASPRPDNLGPLPWLYYTPGTSYLSATDVGVTVSFDNSAAPLQFVLSQYALNGTWLGFRNWTLQLQVCGAPLREAAAWNRFGVDYSSSCTVSAADLAHLQQAGSGGSGEPLFYEPYLAVAGGGLYPLPVRISNKVDSLVGLGAAASDVGHVRRFFYIDSSLSVSTVPAAAGVGPAAIVYPSSLDISITIQAAARNKIYPPVVTVGYSALQMRSSGSSVTGPASFTVRYQNPAELDGAFWYAWRTMLVVFLVLVGAPVLCWRLLLYTRKNSNRPMDAELLLYLVLAAADTLSGTLCIVLFLVSLYWLIMVKLQKAVLLMMVPNDQLYNFWVTVVLAIVGQTCGLLYVLYKQIRTDVFFIDWEKPQRVLSKSGGAEESAPVSCWRQILVVNEWNELQTVRLTYPAFTLLFVVCMLEGANMQASAYITPISGDYSLYGNLQQSLLLKFGIAAVWFFIIGLAQWLLKVLVVHRWVHDPLSSYIDLLFLSNTSVMLLDERQCGYYLHGRNQMPHADTTLQELNQSLLREEEGLVANRGMVTSYVGSAAVPASELNENQVFRVYITPELRRQYDATLLQETEQAAQARRLAKGPITATWQGPGLAPSKTLKAAGELATAFKLAVDEGERNYSTQVLIPNYMQNVFKLPPEASSSRNIFVHDFHNSWSATMFLGQESRLYLWEGLLFCSIYMNAGVSATTAGLVVFICSRLLTLLRQHFGENNLAQKTLVDKRFLI